MTTGLRRQGDEKPREGGSIPCSPVLGGGGTGVCLVSCSGGLSPLTHLGPSPRLRTQTQEAAGGGGLCLKPEVWWAPPPPHPTAEKDPTALLTPVSWALPSLENLQSDGRQLTSLGHCCSFGGRNNRRLV